MKPETLFHLKINHQKGMSFIEVLIALVILVTGILGAVAMQATAKKGSLDALQRSIASALTQDILERMRSNDVNELNNYANTYEAIAPAAITACFTSDTLSDSLALRVEETLQW
jgi:type IV pilus assembly protein PilV